jgi:transcription elongation factor Elf1
MGMFDTFYDKNLKCVNGCDLSKTGFQTKVFDCDLGHYSVGEPVNGSSEFLDTFKSTNNCPHCGQVNEVTGVVSSNVFLGFIETGVECYDSFFETKLRINELKAELNALKSQAFKTVKIYDMIEAGEGISDFYRTLWDLGEHTNNFILSQNMEKLKKLL